MQTQLAGWIKDTAEGVEAGKTLVKYKDVNIGRVTKVELTNDYTKVQVTAKIAKHAAGLMVQDAKFWIVRPSISLTGISGLSTLLSGNYIGFEPGKLDTTEELFTGLDVAPVTSFGPDAAPPAVRSRHKTMAATADLIAPASRVRHRCSPGGTWRSVRGVSCAPRGDER